MSSTQPSDVFFPDIVVLELTGERVLLPVFSLAREHRVRALMIQAFDALDARSQLELSTQFFSPRNLLKFFTECPELWIKLGSELFGRPESWVLDNLTFAEIFREVIARVAPRKGDDTPGTKKPAAWSLDRTLEFLLHEYGWTLEEALAHSSDQITAIMGACAERYAEQNAQSSSKGKKSRPRYERYPGAAPAAPATSADLGKDGGMSSVRAFAARNKIPIKKA